MSIFGQTLTKDNSIEESKELTGGNVLPSGVYKAKIVQAYMREVPNKDNTGKNFYFNWKLSVDTGSVLQEVNINNIFIAKSVNGQVLYYYEKDGKKTEYPSFSSLNRMLRNLISTDLFSAQSEQRNLPVYNFQTQKEEPTQVSVIPQIIGLDCVIGLIEVHQNKRSDETKVVKFNNLEKVWKLVNGQPFTKEELDAGLQVPENASAWKAKFAGTVDTRNLDESKLAGGNTQSKTQELVIG